MSAGTIRLSERSKRLYAKRCAHQPRLLDVPMSYGSGVRAFVRPRRKLPAGMHEGNPGNDKTASGDQPSASLT